MCVCLFVLFDVDVVGFLRKDCNLNAGRWVGFSIRCLIAKEYNINE